LPASHVTTQDLEARHVQKGSRRHRLQRPAHQQPRSIVDVTWKEKISK
jgi:hypothetical protein